MNAADLPCQAHWLGLLAFSTARSLQEALARQISRGERAPTLLLLEHPHTFTFGRSADVSNLLWTPEELKAHGVSVHWTDRGGDVTYHGPGQLVGYPLLPLGSLNAAGRIPQADYVGYMRKLETTLVYTLEQFGIKAVLLSGLTGAWVPMAEAYDHTDHEPLDPPRHEKIASMGVKVDAQGISRHGFSLNVSPDMSYWEGIIACGLADHHAISIAELMQPPPSMREVAQAVMRSFGGVFNYDTQEMHEDPFLDQFIAADPAATELT